MRSQYRIIFIRVKFKHVWKYFFMYHYGKDLSHPIMLKYTSMQYILLSENVHVKIHQKWESVNLHVSWRYFLRVSSWLTRFSVDLLKNLYCLTVNSVQNHRFYKVIYNLVSNSLYVFFWITEFMKNLQNKIWYNFVICRG